MLKREFSSTDNATRPEGKLSFKSGFRSPPLDAVPTECLMPRSCSAALTSSCACMGEQIISLAGYVKGCHATLHQAVCRECDLVRAG